MSDSVLLRDLDAGVLTLTFNRPDKLNAFNDEITRELLQALGTAQRDPAVRVTVLRGEGRGFSAGQDLEAFVRLKSSATPVSVSEHLRNGYNRVAMQIRSMEKPVIASIGGVAAGVGLSIALACDLRIAGDDAILTLGFSKIGLIPDGGGSLFLPLLAGFGRALELAWTSDRIDAREAHRIGLINAVVPAAELSEQTRAYARRFVDVSPAALALTKRAFNRAILPNLAQWLEEEAKLQDEAAAGPDLAEGVRAFMEKRRPAFAAR